MTSPENVKYTTEHEWVALEGDVATIGITDVAASRLGDVVYVDLPAVGADLAAGEVCGEIESTKSVGDLYSPVSGEVLAVNDEAAEEPSLINSDAYGAGWLLRVRVADGALDGLMDREAYVAFAGDA